MSKEIQHKKLSSLLKFVAEHSPYYRRVFAEQKIEIGKINSVADLSSLPFTDKVQLQKYNSEFHSVAKNKFIDHVATSGTTGRPVTISLTDSDLDRLAENESNSFKIAGINSEDTIQLMTTADRRFMAGMAYFLGARQLGAGIIRVGNGLPELQWATIKEMRPTVLICVPSFLVKMLEYAIKNNIDFKSCSVKKAICIGEPIRNQDFSLNTLGKKIDSKWPIQLHSTYASTEMATAFTECEHFQGSHIQEDLIIAEIVDAEGKTVKDGEPGELVVTPLGVEGMPLIRFRTGDICVAHNTPCNCGRSGMRLGPVIGRTNQMIKYKGTTLYPGALYEILEGMKGVENYQVEVSTGELGTDEISINLGISGSETNINPKISDTFKARLRVVPKLNYFSPSQISKMLFPDEGRKPLIFLDKRRT